jgi:peptidoglycan/LPS O-acetylase OafA/YrhL
MALLKYRPDVDGLRALAVLPVVLYHLKVRAITGGYVGVDIFFVISGYLITGLIYKEIQNENYSILRFYERRARRIFPALFVVCGVVALCALEFNLPMEVAAFKDSLIAATLFVSNIYFYITTDYFGPAADTLPLLHTWSLAVEEQFYIFFPLLLLFSHRFFLHAQKLVLVILFALSLAISAWLTSSNPPAAFYLIHSRTWELMIGALLAVGIVPVVKHRAVAEGLGLAGIALIGFSVLRFNDQMAFPGFAALVPCVGAAFIIHSGADHRTYVARGLSLAPIRFVGLISYSLYLWHWPVAVYTLSYWNPLTKVVKTIALAAIFILATLSWKFVEQPFRQRPYRMGSVGVLMASFAAAAFLVAAAFVIGPVSNALWDVPVKAREILATTSGRKPITGKTCFLSSQRDDLALFDRESCLRWSELKPNYLLLGDSMADDLAAGLAENMPEINLLQALSSGCKPVIDAEGFHRCKTLVNSMFQDFVPKHRLKGIILSARWGDKDIDPLVKTIAALKPYVDEVIVLGPRPLYRSPLPRLMAMSMIKGNPSMVATSREDKQQELDAEYAARLRDSGARYVSVYQAMCSDSECLVAGEDGMPVQFDYGHFTRSGSILVVRRLREAGNL